MLKKLFYASASILMLALAYHFGATSAGAQAPGNPVVGVTYVAAGSAFAVTANGDIYISGYSDLQHWTLSGNIFSGATPAAQPTFGQLKAQYRK